MVGGDEMFCGVAGFDFLNALVQVADGDGRSQSGSVLTLSLCVVRLWPLGWLLGVVTHFEMGYQGVGY